MTETKTKTEPKAEPKTKVEEYVPPVISDTELDALRRENEALKARLTLAGKKNEGTPDEGERTLLGWVMPPPGGGSIRRPHFVKRIKDADIYLNAWFKECDDKGWRERGYTIFQPGQKVPDLEPYPQKGENVRGNVARDAGRF